MKKISTIFFFASILFVISCNNTDTETVKDEIKQEEVKQEEVKNIKEQKFSVQDGNYHFIKEESSIKWYGKGISHGHNGSISFSEGILSLENSNIKKGEMTIDMSTILCKDIADAAKNKDLVDHLIGNEIFDVKQFPTAKISILELKDNEIVANLTIKGVTQKISFPFELSSENESIRFRTKLKIDRTKYGVQYNSKNFFENLGDYMIEDEINFSIELVAKLK